MRSPIYIPSEVNQAISRHIKRAVGRAVSAHESGQEDEDTLTGQLGSFIRTGGARAVTVRDGEVRGMWTWAIEYRKFRGRGPKATEKLLGADGIFDLAVHYSGQAHVRKAALFQAKTGAEDRARLLRQCVRLSTWREAAFVIKYSPDAYDALDFDDAMRVALGIGDARLIPLDVFFVEWFVGCLVGDSELHYDAARRTLRWRDINDTFVQTAFAANHRVSVRVDAPPLEGHSKEIDPDKIHEHRMEATDEEILGIGRHPTLAELKRARREAAKGARLKSDRKRE